MNSPQSTAPVRKAPALRGTVREKHSVEADWNVNPQGLARYASIALDHWRSLALGVVIGVVCGILATLFQPVLFRSRTIIEVQGINENFMDRDRFDPQLGTGRFSADQTNLSTQLRLFSVGSLIGKVQEELRQTTRELPSPPSDRLSSVRRLLGIRQYAAPELAAVSIQTAGSRISGSPVSGTRLIEIACESNHPDVSAQFLNRLIQEQMEQTLKDRLSNQQRTTAWLATQVDLSKQKLETAENNIRQFIQQTGATYAGADTETLAQARLKQLQGELSTAQTERIARQARFDSIQRTRKDSLPELLADPTLATYHAQMTDLRRQLADATTTLGSAHPKVQKVQAQLSELQSAIDRQTASIFGRIQSEYESAQRKELMLTSAYLAEKSTLTEQSEQTARYNLLRREIEVARQSYNSILQQYDQITITSALPTNYLRVVEPASPEPVPVRPDLVVNAGFGGALGILVTFLFAVRKDFIRSRTICRPGQSRTLLHVPELGLIPAREEVRRNRTYGLLTSQGKNADALPLEKLVMSGQENPIAEAVRMICAAIQLSRSSRTGARVMVITSPGVGEGKTSLSCNLAIALAQAEQTVVLVDADMRRPRLHDVFQLSMESGLAGALRDSANGEFPKLADFVCPSGIPRLSIIPAGAPQQAPSEILSTSRIRRVLDVLKSEFDVILIDTPPLLPFSESRILAANSDGVILVARHESTECSSLTLAADLLAADGTKLLGVVLNDWKPGSAEAKLYERLSGQRAQYYEQTA